MIPLTYTCGYRIGFMCIDCTYRLVSHVYVLGLMFRYWYTALMTGDIVGTMAYATGIKALWGILSGALER